MTFEKLDKIVVLDVEYTAKSALAIGVGKQPAFEVVESPVIKIGGKPVIPGSSLKGALRSTLEAILAQKGVAVCIPMTAIPRRFRGRRKQKGYVEKLGRKEPCSERDPCPVCQIFGAAGLTGRAIVLDAVPQGEIEPIERTHVAIARDTKAQASGSLMKIQAVDAGAVFEGKIRLVNPEDWQVGAVLQALNGLSQLGMGAKKTAGYGDLDIEVKSIEVKKLGKKGWEATPVEPGSYYQAFSDKFGA